MGCGYDGQGQHVFSVYLKPCLCMCSLLAVWLQARQLQSCLAKQNLCPGCVCQPALLSNGAVTPTFHSAGPAVTALLRCLSTLQFSAPNEQARQKHGRKPKRIRKVNPNQSGADRQTVGQQPTCVKLRCHRLRQH